MVNEKTSFYDSLDRRIQATLEDGSVWKYNYNDRNELVGAHRYWSDWTSVTGQQYGYVFSSTQEVSWFPRWSYWESYCLAECTCEG